MSTETAPPADGTEVRLRRGMPGTYEGQTAIVRHRHPRSGHSNLPGLVWLECEVIWPHGTADGFWAGRSEYQTAPVDENEKPLHPVRDELDATAEWVCWVLDNLPYTPDQPQGGDQ